MSVYVNSSPELHHDGLAGADKTYHQMPERVVHARGVGAYGTFTSYGNWSNITAASFLGAEGKQTNTFVRFSTVAGFRGSADTVRDMHGFATRFYTDEGNYGE